MNMRISGSGAIPSGEYEKISVSGRGSLCGLVRCASFSASGTTKGEALECAEDMNVSGSLSFSGDVKAKRICVSGTLKCNGALAAREAIGCSGTIKCDRSVKCDRLALSGSLCAGDGVEAESIRARGVLNCKGLLNAEEIDLRFDRSSHIGGIGGGKIECRMTFHKKLRRALLPPFSRKKKANRNLSVANAIEGNEIILDGVNCPRVTGENVNIGKGCVIELLQYSRSFTVSPKATVGKIEKI